MAKAADVTKSVTYSSKKVELVVDGGVTKSACPDGGKSCVVTMTLHDNGTFTTTVSEAFGVPPTQGGVNTYQLDATNYIQGSTNLDAILDRVCQDLLSGFGVPVLP